MDSKEFLHFRRELGATQKQLAELLGTSLKAVHSYEQGWRTIPAHAERQLLFLMFSKREGTAGSKPCWTIKKCPTARKEQCPAWKFHAGRFCWFINGTICECKAHKNWQEKMQICRRCEVMAPLFGPLSQPGTE